LPAKYALRSAAFENFEHPDTENGESIPWPSILANLQTAWTCYGRNCDRHNSVSEAKQLACSRDCKFIETSSGIQHNVDELLVGVLKQIRLHETRDKKKQNRLQKRAIHGSKTSLSLHIAKEILHKICLLDSKSKSCGNLHVL